VGGEMAQTMYAHMNKWINKNKERKKDSRWLEEIFNLTRSLGWEQDVPYLLSLTLLQAHSFCSKDTAASLTIIILTLKQGKETLPVRIGRGDERSKCRKDIRGGNNGAVRGEAARNESISSLPLAIT
jgi:hypothetical protein